MGSSRLERKLVRGVVVLFLIPTVVAGVVLAVLYERDVLDNPRHLALAVGIGFLSMMGYVALMAHGLGRALVRTLQEIQLGTELMATVNADHRLRIDTGDEVQSLADEINRMADRVAEARSGLEAEVARATQALYLERSTLAAVLEALGEGVVVATAEGRVTLANRAAQERLAAGGASLLGRSLFDFVDRDKLDHFRERLGSGSAAVARFTLHPAGGMLLDTVMTPLVGDGGRAVGLVLVLRDVTSPVRLAEARERGLAETLRDLRGPVASVRSLAETLLEEPELTGTLQRALGAIHEEALRMSALVTPSGAPARSLAGAPGHFETLAVDELVAMTRRRLEQGGIAGDALQVQIDEGLPSLRVEASAASATLAHLARAVLARRTAGTRPWLRWSQRGGLLRLDLGANGPPDAGDLERLLDEPLPGPPAAGSVRDVVRAHAGECWAYGDGAAFGIRATFPMATSAGDGEPARVPFVGAGTASGAGPAAPAARPDFYDFSLLDEMERHLAPTDRERPLDQLMYVVLDVETTGLQPDRGDRIVSLAGVKVRGGAVRRGEVFDALVHPGRAIPSSSVRFHGITDAMVADQPPIEVVLPAFLRFTEGAVLVGHQVWFDMRFLGRTAARLGLPSPSATHAVLDTLTLSEIVHGPMTGHGLDEAAARLGVEIRGRHSALGDALATAEILVRLIALLRKRGIVTLGQAMQAARRVRRPWPGGDAGGAGR